MTNGLFFYFVHRSFVGIFLHLAFVSFHHLDLASYYTMQPGTHVAKMNRTRSIFVTRNEMILFKKMKRVSYKLVTTRKIFKRKLT